MVHSHYCLSSPYLYSATAVFTPKRSGKVSVSFDVRTQLCTQLTLTWPQLLISTAIFTWFHVLSFPFLSCSLDSLQLPFVPRWAIQEPSTRSMNITTWKRNINFRHRQLHAIFKSHSLNKVRQSTHSLPPLHNKLVTLLQQSPALPPEFSPYNLLSPAFFWFGLFLQFPWGFQSACSIFHWVYLIQELIL